MSKLSSSLALADVDVISQYDTANNLVLTNAIELPSDDQTMLDKLEYWAAVKPDAEFLCEPENDSWRSIGYAQFLEQVRGLSAKLLTLGLDSGKPLLLLSPNSIDHALVTFACMYVGIPVAPVSPAYGLMAKTFDRLQQIIEILQPGVVYVNDADLFSRSVSAINDHYSFPIIASKGSQPGVRSLDSLVPLREDQVSDARQQVTPDSIAKIMFTSGSTGVPKGVLNSHRMMYSNQMALTYVWPFLQSNPPRIVDWLPWSHTFGGNVCFNSILFNGGVFFIDDGKPSPNLIGRTVANLKAGRPNLHYNVPAGIEALLNQLEVDVEFSQVFFENLDVLFVAAAALPQKTRDRIIQCANTVGATPPKLLAGWGSTETAPFATAVYFDSDRADNIGVPMPGTKIKLARNEDKLELCVKGPNVTRGYWNNIAASKQAFDDDGFLRMGDAGKLIDETCAAKGIVFDGRLSENFKLLSGTWVNVGKLRVAVIDYLRPLCTDVVVTGQNQTNIGLLLVLNPPAIDDSLRCGAAIGDFAALVKSEPLIAELSSRIDQYNVNAPSNSTAVKHFTILPELPQMDRGEITDKGYINQRRVLENWSDLVAQLHSQVAGSLFDVNS